MFLQNPPPTVGPVGSDLNVLACVRAGTGEGLDPRAAPLTRQTGDGVPVLEPRRKTQGYF